MIEKASMLFESLPKFKNEKQQQLAIQIASIVVASSVLYSSYRLISGSNKLKGLKDIPEPKSSYPYVGHLLSLGEFPSKTVTQWHKELGPIIKLRMGAQTWIMVDSPALAHKIFVTNGADTSHRPQSEFTQYASKGGKGIALAQPGHQLKESRSAALTVLAPKMIVEKYMGTIKQEADDLVSRLIESSETENGVNPLKFLELNSINVIFSACFGRKFKSIEDPEFIKLSTLIEETMKVASPEKDLTNFFPFLGMFEFLSNSQMKLKDFIVKRHDPVFRELIREALNIEGPNVIKSLDENGFNLTEEEKIPFASDLITAATDTTSVTLLWSFAILCHHPEVQKKVAEEIDHFVKVNGRIPEFTERNEVPYCISVIKECMRFKPTTPFGLPHFVNKDVEVDGYLIPKGATVIANMVSLHAQEDHYPDPTTFRPDRFMDNLKTMQSAANGKFEERDHFNFGFGRRVCPGIYLAETELFCAFVRVFSRTHIEPVNGVMPDINNAENGGLTLTPVPYTVKFVKR